MIDRQNIKYISALIQKRELVFFTGAGISLLSPSNLIMFNHLQNKIIWALYQNLDEELIQTYIDIYEEIDKGKGKSDTANKFMCIPPEYIFELCKNEIICNNEESNYPELTPLDSFRNATPNLNHLYLARLLLTGHTPAIFTTNFDLLIESGIKELSHKTENSITFDKSWRASVLAGIGNLLLKQEKYDECLIYYKEAEYLFNETGNILKLSRILHALAITYYKNNKPKEARKYAEHSLVYCEIMADHEGHNKIRELLRAIVG